MTTRSPDCRSAAKSLRYSATSPPELDRMGTSAATGVTAIRDKTANHTKRRTEPSLGQAERDAGPCVVHSAAGDSTGQAAFGFHPGLCRLPASDDIACAAGAQGGATSRQGEHAAWRRGVAQRRARRWPAAG